MERSERAEVNGWGQWLGMRPANPYERDLSNLSAVMPAKAGIR